MKKKLIKALLAMSIAASCAFYGCGEKPEDKDSGREKEESEESDEDDEEEHEHHHHDHDHHHHHHADEIFDSIGFETPKTFTEEQIDGILDALSDEEKYGIVLRSKGMVPARDGGFIYFDYVPEEKNVRPGAPDVTGKIVVIGSKIKESELKNLFGI